MRNNFNIKFEILDFSLSKYGKIFQLVMIKSENEEHDADEQGSPEKNIIVERLGLSVKSYDPHSKDFSAFTLHFNRTTRHPSN